ncbi:MAG: AAA family ATPase [Candidatus Altiarchaeales archaeon]|nr:AAA family ATPase [Candidatus Altiarchaeales archaeon]
MSERCPTGISGLDEILGGGFPRGRCILLSGGSGTGKTTFGVQFLVEGIKKHSENGVLVTLEQNSGELRDDMTHYGFNIQEMEDSQNLILIDTSLAKVGIKEYLTSVPLEPDSSFSLLPDEFDMEKIVDLTVSAAEKIGAKRVVIDSLPALDYMIENEADVRRSLINMNYQFKEAGLTAVLITESLEDNGITRHAVEEYITDGVIILKANEALDTRTLRIHKMRVTKHTLKPISFNLTPEGIHIEAPKHKL